MNRNFVGLDKGKQRRQTTLLVKWKPLILFRTPTNLLKLGFSFSFLFFFFLFFFFFYTERHHILREMNFSNFTGSLYVYIIYISIILYIFIYMANLCYQLDECDAARRAAPMPDPSSVALRITCLAISSPNISIKPSCKYSLNIV